MIIKKKGKGEFSLDGEKFEAEFEFIQNLSMESLIVLTLNRDNKISSILEKSFMENKDPVKCSLIGTLENNANIKIEELYLISTPQKNLIYTFNFKIASPIVTSSKKFPQSDGNDESIHFFITNLDFIGTDGIIKPEGGWRKDRFRINIDGYDIVFKQLEGYDDIIKKLKKEHKYSGAFTTEIIVKTEFKNYSEVKSIVEKLCYLLSFAKGTDIIASVSSKIKSGKIVWEQSINIGRRPFRYGGVIAKLSPNNLVNFLEETYPQFSKYHEDFGLNVIFNFYTAMKFAFYIELRCLIGFVLLETLATNIQPYYEKIKSPIISSIAKNKEKELRTKILPKDHNLSEEDIQKIKEKLIYNHPTLEDCVKKISDDFKFLPESEDKKLFGYRKNFIHYGKAPSGVGQIELYNQLVNLIDRILLSILGYTGEYSDERRRGFPTDMKYK